MNAIIDNPKFQEIDSKLNTLGYMLLYGAIKPDGMLSLYATPLNGVTPTIAADESNNQIKIQMGYDKKDYSIEEAMNIAMNLDNALDAAQYLQGLVDNKEIFQLEKVTVEN